MLICTKARKLTAPGAEAGDTMNDGPPERTVGQAPAAEKDPPRTACVCEGGGLRAAVRDDLDRYVFIAQQQLGKTGRLLPFRTALMSKGLWATAAYRWNHYAQHRARSRLLRVLPGAFHRAVVALTGIHIDTGAHIGPGLAFAHGGPAVIGPVRVGRNCDIYHGVTFGASMSLDDRNPRPGVPTLGDRVWVGPGAVIAGDVTVGDDAAVGAISLVVRDVPPRGVVVGVPARVVSRRGSFAQVIYRGMDTDDERKAALAADENAGPAPAG
jgi:serine O-acetyltransferase